MELRGDAESMKDSDSRGRGRGRQRNKSHLFRAEGGGGEKTEGDREHDRNLCSCE